MSNDFKVLLTVAKDHERQEIFKIRHEVYARELHQHLEHSTLALQDNLDMVNHYIVAKQKNRVVGFISITPPSAKKYSVDKYFDRSSIPFPFDDSLYEIRLLTVLIKNRKSPVAFALMYAAFRWVHSHGGRHIVAICREDFLQMYRKAGLQSLNVKTKAGEVTYVLSVANTDELYAKSQKDLPVYVSLKDRIDWQLPYSFFAPFECYHGGSFFKAIGEDLQTLEKAAAIINADVLDAWFPPSPCVLKVINENLAWLLQTSPPTHAGGLVKVIAATQGVSEQCILPGAGSSDLIFLALRTLLNSQSKVLIIDPCYGEYIHVLEHVIQCSVERFVLSSLNDFVVDTDALLTEIGKGYDMVILVNPNSPTGVHIPRIALERLLRKVPSQTWVWLDETYVDFVSPSQSLQQFAVQTENVIICKSMSKVYALSGVRAAYLCCSPHIIESFRRFNPPWAVSLPAQAAAIAALSDPSYYQGKYEETHMLRNKLRQQLLEAGMRKVINGVANFLLFYLPDQCKDTARFLELCNTENLFLRDVSNMGKSIEKGGLRIAVKDEATNYRMMIIIERALQLAK